MLSLLNNFHLIAYKQSYVWWINQISLQQMKSPKNNHYLKNILIHLKVSANIVFYPLFLLKNKQLEYAENQLEFYMKKTGFATFWALNSY